MLQAARAAKKAKGEGKGKGKQKGKAFLKRSNVSIEERKRKLADLKKRTKCSACGQIGHWAGDDCCQKKGQMQRIQPQAHVATTVLPTILPRTSKGVQNVTYASSHGDALSSDAHEHTNDGVARGDVRGQLGRLYPGVHDNWVG